MMKSTVNARSMLLDLGVGSFVADMSIPYLWFVPGAADPDSPAVIEIIKAMQRGLRSIGYGNIKVNGVLDRETAAALDQVSPPRGSWMEKSFIQLLGDIISATKNPDRVAHKASFGGGLGGYFNYQGKPPGPLPGYMVGLPPGPLGMDGLLDTPLTFGQGTKNKTNIIPIPKKSGPTYAAFKNLQRQLNRVLSLIPGGGRIAEDGIIGQETLDGLRRVKSAMGIFGIPLKFENTLDVANRAVSLADALKTYADERGASTRANVGAATTAASISEPTPARPIISAHTEMVQSTSAIKKYAPFLLGAAVIAWFAATQKKTKKKKRKS
jgi:hypothetical protein